jgi:hypothetical protein
MIKSVLNGTNSGMKGPLPSDIWNDSRSTGPGYLATISTARHRADLSNLCLGDDMCKQRVTVVASTQVVSVELNEMVQADGSVLLEAVGVWGADAVSGCRTLICPQNGGEILLCAGALGTPAILANSQLPVSQPSDSGDECESGKLSCLRSSLFGGGGLLDHTILPMICLGNWYRDHAATPPDASACSSLPEEEGSAFPPNSVHGWVYLDREGNLFDESANSPPRC